MAQSSGPHTLVHYEKLPRFKAVCGYFSSSCDAKKNYAATVGINGKVSRHDQGQNMLPSRKAPNPRGCVSSTQLIPRQTLTGACKHAPYQGFPQQMQINLRFLTYAFNIPDEYITIEGNSVGNYIVWKPYYSVKNESLDAEHKVIFGLINELRDAVIKKQADLDLRAISDRLVQYTNTHFKHEERLLMAADYPNLAEHLREHEKLRRRSADFRDNLNLVTGQDMLRFLKDWWCQHIQETDKRYAPYLMLNTAEAT